MNRRAGRERSGLLKRQLRRDQDGPKKERRRRKRMRLRKKKEGERREGKDDKNVKREIRILHERKVKEERRRRKRGKRR